jgi:hypothetical protein
MKRGTALALLVCLTAAGGCTSPAHSVAWNPVSGAGTVAIPNNTDVWPNHNRTAALELIEKEVGGKNYVITSEGEVVTGRSTTNSQQVNTEQTANPRNPNQTGQQQTVTGSVTQQNLTEYRISFQRTPPAASGPAGMPVRTPTTTGLTTAGGTGGWQGASPNPVPSVLPPGGNVLPAGGMAGNNYRSMPGQFGSQP